MTKYVVISPVRNEEEYLRITADSLINQTVKPVQWILVNDGSTDGTEAIIDELCAKNDWIYKINKENRGYYLPGRGVVEVFNKGFENIKIKDWEYVVKLDTDLKFDVNYFELIFEKFRENDKLGMASGCTYLPINENLVREPTQEDHPVGPSKVYKRECWEDIGGMMPVPGWDLADLLSAQMKGWETRCYFDLKLTHYRQTGSRRKGLWAPKFLQGRFVYRHGYSFGYIFLREIMHLFKKPIIIGSIGQITGFIYAKIKGDEFIFPEDMRKFLRAKHKKFIKSKIGIK